MRTVPKWVVVTTAIAVASLLMTLLLGWWVDQMRRAEEHRDCERSVAIRDDNRSMWLYVVDTSTSADTERVDAFVIELNKRLPRLECRDGDPVPVED